jgi:hypothetical protein
MKISRTPVAFGSVLQGDMPLELKREAIKFILIAINTYKKEHEVNTDLSIYKNSDLFILFALLVQWHFSLSPDCHIHQNRDEQDW